MNITKETVDKMAHLARLEFDAAAGQQMMKDLSDILNWVEKLNEVNTEGIEPLTHMSAEINVLREDKPSPGLSREDVLANAPHSDSDYFRVPKVLE